LLKDFGMRELEVRAIDSRMDLPRWAAETGWTPLRGIALLKQQQVKFRVAGSSFKLVGNDQKSRAELIEFTEWADSWGATYIRAFGGGTCGQPLTNADYDHAAGAVAWWQHEKQIRGWQTELLLETHDAFSGSAPCVELNKRLENPIGIIWDTHHTWRLAGESPQDSWEQLSNWVRHVHVKDSVNKPSARHPYTYVLPGTGEAPLADIVGLLSEFQFKGAVSLEWERLWHPYLAPLRDALAKLASQSWFASSAKTVHEHQSSVVTR
jgi:sugar phosphate isomerase/epimerase